MGHTPLIDPTISARAVADIVAAHLRDAAPDHLQPPCRTGSSTAFDIEHDASESGFAAAGLDTHCYERGIAACAAAHACLGSVTSVLDDVEDRAMSLLAALSELLDVDEDRFEAAPK